MLSRDRHIEKSRLSLVCRAKVFWSVSSRALSSKNNNVRVRRSKLIHTQLTDQVWRDERMAVLVPKDKRARVTYIRTLPTYFLLCRLATAIRRRNKFTLAKPAYIWPVSKVGGDGNRRCVCRLWKWKQREGKPRFVHTVWNQEFVCNIICRILVFVSVQLLTSLSWYTLRPFIFIWYLSVQVYSDCVSHSFAIRVHDEQLPQSRSGRLDRFTLVDRACSLHQGTHQLN